MLVVSSKPGDVVFPTALRPIYLLLAGSHRRHHFRRYPFDVSCHWWHHWAMMSWNSVFVGDRSFWTSFSTRKQKPFSAKCSDNYRPTRHCCHQWCHHWRHVQDTLTKTLLQMPQPACRVCPSGRSLIESQWQPLRDSVRRSPVSQERYRPETLWSTIGYVWWYTRCPCIETPLNSLASLWSITKQLSTMKTPSSSRTPSRCHSAGYSDVIISSKQWNTCHVV